MDVVDAWWWFLFIDCNDLGTVWTASAHIITAVIGSGVLSLAWAIAQLGWIAGPAFMFLFSLVTYYTSTLLSVCYRTGDPVNGKRNYTYMDAVLSNLGKFCCCFDLKVSVLSRFLSLIKLHQVEPRSRFVDLFSILTFSELPLVIR